MSNHIHLLIQSKEVPLESIFRKINTTYANWFNLKYSRSGPLQDGRYYSQPINSLNYLLCALRYIHRNPLKANLEKTIGSKYPWNSYTSYTNQNDNLVDIKAILCEFASIDDFVKYHFDSTSDTDNDFIDINNIKHRIPDDVAVELIKKSCNINHPTDISNFSLLERRNAIFLLNEKGISARQINRLTGIPRGIIDRILSDKI